MPHICLARLALRVIIYYLLLFIKHQESLGFCLFCLGFHIEAFAEADSGAKTSGAFTITAHDPTVLFM